MWEMSTEGDSKWLCAGDFNEVCFHSEKIGGIACDWNRMEEFRVAIEDCGLFDMGYNGYKFTWSNNQEDPHHIKERLDRFLASNGWTNICGNYTVEHLVRKSSDHCPIILDMKQTADSRIKKRLFFRLEAMWFKDQSFMQVCRGAWNCNSLAPHNSGELQQMVIECGHTLKAWERKNFGNITKQIRLLRGELKELMAAVNDHDTLKMRKQIEGEIDELLAKEETMWKQRSRALWLQDGDRNTAYFHKVADGRNRRNQIKQIVDAAGMTHTKAKDVETVFRHFFEELFTSQGENDMDDVLSAIETSVTPEMNRFLMEPYTAQEIVEALAQMHPLKSPGPDGMPALFYHKCWDFVKSDFIPVILDILNNHGDHSFLNSTHICLIPKKKNSSLPSDYRLFQNYHQSHYHASQENSARSYTC